MTDINKALHAIIDEDIIQPIIYGEGVDPKSYFGIDADELVAKIKALVVEQLPQEKRPAEMTLNMNEIQVAEYDSEIIGFNQCLGEIRSIYE